MKLLFLVLSTAILFTVVSGHGSMITPPPRSAHSQKFDDQNKCGCASTPGGCYSNASAPGYYCGLGCIGEACLYYQIGCFQSCPECSYVGKTLYPVPDDLKKAGNCPVPPAPKLGGGDAEKEHALRTYNIDNFSKRGDWTKWNPWRSPGTAGKGNLKFQPCGVNSGSNPSFPDPPAHGQKQFANGTDLPPISQKTIWKMGSVVDAEWSIYANHGGGYSYRLCKKVKGKEVTEECFQQMPLDFATDSTTIKYYDGSRKPFDIKATTTDEGTYPKGSQWRKNPIPMCNCDMGVGCNSKNVDYTKLPSHAIEMIKNEYTRATKNNNNKNQQKNYFVKKKTSSDGGKHCTSVTKDKCGDMTGVNTCLSCSPYSAYDCEECCPGLERVTKGEYSWCVKKGSKPTAECSETDPRGCYFLPYNKTYLAPNQKTPLCETGLMFPSSWDDGYGNGYGENNYEGYGSFMFSMTDKLQVPKDIESGEYSLSWRWDCEQTPQVWNSCADITIEQ